MPWQSQGGNGGGSGGGGPGAAAPAAAGPGGPADSGGAEAVGASGGGGGGGPGGHRISRTFIRKGQDRVQAPHARRRIGGKGLILIGLVLFGLYLDRQPDFTGCSRTRAWSRLMFGEVGRPGVPVEPGLRWHWPYPDRDRRAAERRAHQLDRRGFSPAWPRPAAAPRQERCGGGKPHADRGPEHHRYRVHRAVEDIGNAGKYLFEIRDPESTVKIGGRKRHARDHRPERPAAVAQYRSARRRGKRDAKPAAGRS